MDDQTIARFWSRVDIRGPNDCWLWNHTNRHPFGYGRMKVNYKGWDCHRLAWTIANGPIPPGGCILHQCDVPACCNPAHLELGTRSKNTGDMHLRGRGPQLRGEGNMKAKLTVAQVQTIRASTDTNVALARRFGVTRFSIMNIRSRRTWSHVP